MNCLTNFTRPIYIYRYKVVCEMANRKAYVCCKEALSKFSVPKCIFKGKFSFKGVGRPEEESVIIKKKKIPS